jgi:hypothetical protein
MVTGEAWQLSSSEQCGLQTEHRAGNFGNDKDFVSLVAYCNGTTRTMKRDDDEGRGG